MVSMNSLHLCALRGDAPLPRQYGFPHLRALWGDTPLPPPQRHLGVPTSPPWAGPVVDAAIAEGERRNKILRTGNSLPAHLYSEDSSPIPAWWWPMNIEHLHREAMDEELYLKYKFRLQFPFRPQIHVDRATQSVEFLHERMLLNARLAASYAIFFLRTRLKEGITSSAAALAGALAAARAADAAAAAAAALEHTQSLLDDEFLAAWLARPVADIALWGTAHDPRDVPLPPVNTGGWANTGGWGNGGGWGTGWGDWPPVVRKRRRMPRPYGYRRMGVIFRPPRVVGRRYRLRERLRRWIDGLERRWRLDSRRCRKATLALYILNRYPI
ncbi:hypothetical protein B0H14DRAFT_2648359 [Mycena olivaceomarginata]|nr:hypothetical protein B0H14DRAFT_2648359 [Mycena olivaceomarginata]